MQRASTSRLSPHRFPISPPSITAVSVVSGATHPPVIPSELSSSTRTADSRLISSLQSQSSVYSALHSQSHSHPHPNPHPPHQQHPYFFSASEPSPATQVSWASESMDDHDGALSNPVRLLTEAAEEHSSGSSAASREELPFRKETTTKPPLPIQYRLPETIRAMLNEEPTDQWIHVLTSDVTYLGSGILNMVIESARESLSVEDKAFFKPPRKDTKRDLGPEYDPVALALLTEQESAAFFDSFFAKLHPMLPVLDPSLHTPVFVRSRSSFLFTAICAHGASFLLGAEEATKRLRIHAQRLLEMVSRRGFASVEVVQAFLIWVSWLPSTLCHSRFLDNVDHTDSVQVQRIARNRERSWINLFLWDSRLSMVFGQATRLVQNDLIRNEEWSFHDLAIPEDVVTTASVALRRRLGVLSDALRSEIYMRPMADSNWVVKKVDEVLQSWYSFWIPRCNSDPYLELVYQHTRDFGAELRTTVAISSF
ncbi:hypothetical protein IAT40_005863 [Kwoniella sp. CBS 6097]